MKFRSPEHDEIATRLQSHLPYGSGLDTSSSEFFMLAEDIANGVVPVMAGTAKHQEFTAQLIGSDDERSRAIELFDRVYSFDRHDMREDICDLIGELAKELAWNGSAAFEIATSEVGTPLLVPLPRRTLFRLPFLVTQVIPAKRAWFSRPTFNFCASRHVWLLDMPTSLGGYEGHMKMLRKLSTYSRLVPAFYNADLMSGRGELLLDFTEYRNSVDIACRRISRTWGWNQRDFGNERTTEFYLFFNSISMRIAQAQLREHILRKTNDLLKRVGIACSIEIAGLPSADELIKIREKLSTGELTFGQAFDASTL